ncbi:hypothetical protein NEF87_000465 [Candidatus Lokiarchaeum ossiferum]|uniref:MalT-like TPR region domain-containing protein n=1 Tax=Candidatus Lokiarchaeum ossiferum TaxID=2951803 RepID=A0ABY6HL99_9ARCH|nr:hypothetical protein NEF87_000465 [Candidatus Lokiarchaeum sp. B-35]
MGMLKYSKEMHVVAMYCGKCKKQIEFQIPEDVFQVERDHYPFTFRYIHGLPVHSVTLFIDKHGDIRGTEFDDAIKLSQDVITSLLERHFSSELLNGDINKQTLSNTHTESTFSNNFVPDYSHGILKKAKEKYAHFQYHEALTLLVNYDSVEKLTLEGQLAFFLLQIDLFYSLSWFKDALKAAEWVYENSKTIGNRLVMLDALLSIGKASLRLGLLEKANDCIIQCDSLFPQIQDLPQPIIEKRKFVLNYNKGRYFWQIGELENALDQAKLQLEGSINYGNDQDRALGNHCVGLYYMQLGDFAESLKFTTQALEIAKTLNDKMLMARSYNNIGEILRFQGKLDNALSHYEKALETNKELLDNREIAINLANIGSIYFEKSDYTNAEKSIVESLDVQLKFKDDIFHVELLFILVKIYLARNNLQSAQSCLQKIQAIYANNQLLRIKIRFTLAKGLILKKKGSLRNIIEARILLTYLLIEKSAENELKIQILVNLCDLLFKELEITSDLEIISEIQSQVDKLHSIALEEKSFSLLSEIYFFQAKLKLLDFQLDEYANYMLEAQKIAAEHNLSQLLDKISTEYDKYLKEAEKWVELKSKNAPISERLQLIALEKNVNKLLMRDG